MCINSIKDLIDKPFKCFSREEQLEIVRKGRFTDLKHMSQNDNGKQRNFWTTWYQKAKWLSGDPTTKKLYCWNCVLFPSGQARVWSKVGFDDLRNLSQATKKHEDSREHTYATVKLKLLTKKIEKSKSESRGNFEKNLRVKRNREYLERLIDISTTLALAEVPFRRGPEEKGAYESK